jgi:nicotinate-nucleotide adenylyltransferase
MDRVIRRLGILGGTFDPIHHAHLVAAGEARSQLELDCVLFVPAGDPPHKPLRPVSPAAHRLRMLELAIGHKSEFAVSRVDLDRSGPSYTADALRLLRAEWGPEPEFFFIEGSDSLAEILTWYHPERILELTNLAVVQRSGAPVDVPALEARLPGISARLYWVRMPLLEISATDLRSRVRDGRPISYLLPPAVEAYIYEQGLYKDLDT